MMKRIYLFFLSVSFLITGCDYLDMVPEDDIKTVETVLRLLRVSIFGIEDMGDLR